MNSFYFWVNDQLLEIKGLPHTMTLLKFLREELGLTGTKEGCNEGECGACTVVFLDEDACPAPKYRCVNSCLILLPMMQNRRVYTVEGLENKDSLHPVQKALVEHQASQCGFCTPGIAMSLFEATYRLDLDSEWKTDAQMAGNICRCTGYKGIREAALKVAGTRPEDKFSKLLRDAVSPKRAKHKNTLNSYISPQGSFYSPTNIDSLFELLDKHPNALFVTGGTDLGVLVNKEQKDLSCLVSLEAIPELRAIQKTKRGLSIGASVPLSDIEESILDLFPPLARMLRYFGSRQIKHRATIGGNLCNASPVGDLAPVLLALGATCIIRSANKKRYLPIEDFFHSYRKTSLQTKEILEAVEIPRIPKKALVSSYKVSKRRELNISALSACFFIQKDRTEKILEARLAYGGMAAIPIRAKDTEKKLLNLSWSKETVEEAALLLEQEMKPIDDIRASAWYRSKVAANLFRGFFLETLGEALPKLTDRPSGTVLKSDDSLFRGGAEK